MTTAYPSNTKKATHPVGQVAFKVCLADQNGL